MSRVGKRVIKLPAGTTINIKGNEVEVKGKNGTLVQSFSPLIAINIKGDEVTTTRANEEKSTKELHGTTNSLLSGMVIGVSEGFKKELEIKGVGYKATVAGDTITINAGYSHPVILKVIPGVKVEAPKSVELIVTGASKQAVGQMAAMIRDVRRPSVYSGKGIMYKGEQIRRKEGKSAAK